MTRQGKRTAVGPLAAYVDGFRSFALAWGYSPATAGMLVKEMRSMSAWMLETGHDVGEVSEGLVAAYRAWLPGRAVDGSRPRVSSGRCWRTAGNWG